MSATIAAAQQQLADGGVDQMRLLVIAVAVLGTLVAVGLLVGGVWLCVLCYKEKYNRRKWCKSNQGIEGFPHQREMVELGHIPPLAHSPRHHLPSNPSVNDTGISRHLGLRRSYPAEQLPALLPPKSWTPSPPFYPGETRSAFKANTQNSHTHQRKNKAKRVRVKTIETYSPEWEKAKCVFCDTHGHPSTNHPVPNTVTTENWSPIHTTPSSSSSHLTLGFRRQPPDPLGSQHAAMNPYYRKRHKRGWKKSRQLVDSSTRSRKKENAETKYYDTKRDDRGTILKKGTFEPPEACSSHHGSPGLHHLPPETSHYVAYGYEQPFQREKGSSYHLESVPLESLRHRKLSGNVLNIKQNSIAKHKLNVTLDTQRERDNMKQEQPLTQREMNITKPRRQWGEHSCFQNEVLPPNISHSGPYWMERLQATSRQGVHKSSSLLHRPAHCLADGDQEQEVYRRISLKYGFCETCGIEQSLKQQLKTALDNERNQQPKHHDCSTSSFDDATPSMSWDNLTPDPSLALANTQPQQILEGEGMASAEIDDKQDSKKYTNDECDDLIPTLKNT